MPPLFLLRLKAFILSVASCLAFCIRRTAFPAVLLLIHIGFPASDVRAQPRDDALQEGDTLTVTIFHSNDVYGEISRMRSQDGYIGGMAPRIRLIREARDAGPVLALDAGNALGPAALSSWDQGAAMIDLMRLAGYKALLPANHEFDYGLEMMKHRRTQAGFPFLVTNLSDDEKAGFIARHLLINAEGLRIGVIGLLSREIAVLTNPGFFNGIQITDPLPAAAAAVDTLRKQGADYIIALTNMKEDETMSLARQVQGVDLVIAGGYRRLNQVDLIPGLIRLVDGTQIVTTPGAGRFLGRVTVPFVAQAEGGFVPARSTARLHRMDFSVPDDLDAAAIIARKVHAYAVSGGDTIGYISESSHQGQARIIAQLMRRRTEAEIGIINLGLITHQPGGQPLIRRDINRFIRFPNAVHIIDLTGAQIRTAVSQSGSVDRTNARLIFAGIDPSTLLVDGRPLKDTEQYRVAVTDFLANGGDGYAVFTQGIPRLDTGMELRALLMETLQTGGRLTAASFRQGGRRGIWHSGLQVEGAFERNYIDRTTEAYRAQNEAAPFLSGATTVAWNGALRYFLEREQGPHITRFQNRMDFSQIGKSFGELTPATDQIETELRYRYRTLSNRGDPFVSAGLNTAFTNTGGQRPMQALSTVGFEFQPFESLIARVAGRSQRDFVADQTDLGGELTLEWTRPLPSGAQLSSRVRSFFGATTRRIISVENYNAVSFPLLGDVRLNVRQNNFLYRVNSVSGAAAQGVAVRSIITVGFAYGLNWKWL